ncbi:MAG: hypothetical protein DRJ03_07410 [Chloroflexi bacterium]|nr:MAG: hypothetical protein DRJ03_07410 [Chloroflexota bacterium]
MLVFEIALSALSFTLSCALLILTVVACGLEIWGALRRPQKQWGHAVLHAAGLLVAVVVFGASAIAAVMALAGV